MDALRAPNGYELDCAVGTTYSVDLTSALLVPMALALFDTESGTIEKNPLEVLAATQTYASRVALYCEQGRIATAAKQPGVMAYLESMLHPVRPPANGAFHPKLWVLRFKAANSGDRIHRVLCLSRNLTFDRSWDTIVRLEQSESGDTAATAPLIRFVRFLNGLGESPEAGSIAASLRGVAFDPPRGFESISFHPFLGDGSQDDPLADGGDDLLVVSPFLVGGRLTSLLDRWKRVRVVSRPESLDRIDPALLGRIRAKDLFQFDSPVLDEEPEQSSTPVAEEDLAETLHLSGLHAKVNAAEVNGSSYLFLGSANATIAAFNRNVEFGVLLRVPKKAASPGSLLKGDGNEPSELRSLLRPYPLREAATEESPQEAELRRLENLRRDIADVGLVARVSERESSYELKLSSKRRLPSLERGDRLECWPVTLPESSKATVGSDRRALASFTIRALGRTTGLIGFRLSSRMPGVPEVRFTLLAGLKGDVGDRLDAVMAEILTDRDRLMRFLFLLLASGSDEAAHVLGPIRDGENGGSNGHGPTAESQPPLLETLLRAYSRDRSRLDAFSDALRTFERLHKKGADTPKDILQIWRPIQAALDAEKGKSR
jgi:hypothetical protein